MSTASTTTFQIAEESLDECLSEAIATLNATRSDEIGEERFDWLYRQNPDGEAVLWSIRDSQTGEMAGFTVALPRRMLVNGELRNCWNGADFSIKPRFRTLGLAIKLRREAKRGVDAGRVDFLYAHPNERMALIHQKVGHTPVGRMLRYAKVLRTGGYLRQTFGNGAAAGLAASALDPALRLLSRESRHRTSCDVQLLNPFRFDKRFDELFASAAPNFSVIGVRDADYLNWRYADNPLYQTHALVAGDGDRLLGYLLFTVNDGAGMVKDIFPPGEPEVARDLIAKFIKTARRIGLDSVTVTALEGNPLLPLFREFGCRRRADSSQMFAYAATDRPWAETVTQSDSWFLTVGDRDV